MSHSEEHLQRLARGGHLPQAEFLALLKDPKAIQQLAQLRSTGQPPTPSSQPISNQHSRPDHSRPEHSRPEQNFSPHLSPEQAHLGDCQGEIVGWHDAFPAWGACYPIRQIFLDGPLGTVCSDQAGSDQADFDWVLENLLEEIPAGVTIEELADYLDGNPLAADRQKDVQRLLEIAQAQPGSHKPSADCRTGEANQAEHLVVHRVLGETFGCQSIDLDCSTIPDIQNEPFGSLAAVVNHLSIGAGSTTSCSDPLSQTDQNPPLDTGVLSCPAVDEELRGDLASSVTAGSELPGPERLCLGLGSIRLLPLAISSATGAWSVLSCQADLTACPGQSQTSWLSSNLNTTDPAEVILRSSIGQTLTAWDAASGRQGCPGGFVRVDLDVPDGDTFTTNTIPQIREAEKGNPQSPDRDAWSLLRCDIDTNGMILTNEIPQSHAQPFELSSENASSFEDLSRGQATGTQATGTQASQTHTSDLLGTGVEETAAIETLSENSTTVIHKVFSRVLQQQLDEYKIHQHLLRWCGVGDPALGQLSEVLYQFLLEKAQKDPAEVQTLRQAVSDWWTEFARQNNLGMTRVFTLADWPEFLERCALEKCLTEAQSEEPIWAEQFRRRALSLQVQTIRALRNVPPPETIPSRDVFPWFLRDLIGQVQHIRNQLALKWELASGETEQDEQSGSPASNRLPQKCPTTTIS